MSLQESLTFILLHQDRISFGNPSSGNFMPHYAAPIAAIMGYNSYLLPVPFQYLTFEIQRTLFRCFDRVELSAFRQIDDILPGAAQ